MKQWVQLKEEDGNFTVMIDFPDVDEKTKEEIKTLRTPADTVQRMQELQEHRNLFRSNLVSGIGSGQSHSDPGDIDYSNLTPEQYRQKRAEIKDRLERERLQ
jgi:hypothetical protein